jgi:hypothetical protein
MNEPGNSNTAAPAASRLGHTVVTHSIAEWQRLANLALHTPLERFILRWLTPSVRERGWEAKVSLELDSRLLRLHDDWNRLAEKMDRDRPAPPPPLDESRFRVTSNTGEAFVTLTDTLTGRSARVPLCDLNGARNILGALFPAGTPDSLTAC